MKYIYSGQFAGNKVLIMMIIYFSGDSTDDRSNVSQYSV